MPFESLYNDLPHLALNETKAVNLPLADNEFGLPAGFYLFVEMFCNEKDCDCRKVIFSVFQNKQKDPWAYISYGWESESFYKKWLRSDDKALARQLMKPSLSLMAPQSVYARKILGLFNKMLLPQTSYLAKVKEHYKLFRKGL